MTGAGVPESGPIQLSAEEAEFVSAAAAAYAAVLPPERAAPWEELGRTAREGEVPAELVGLLEQVTALAVESGQARRLGLAEAERALRDVFARTPRGRALARRVEEVNRALRALAGRRLGAVRVAAAVPGRCTLTLEAEGVSVAIAVDREGVRVESLGAG